MRQKYHQESHALDGLKAFCTDRSEINYTLCGTYPESQPEQHYFKNNGHASGFFG